MNTRDIRGAHKRLQLAWEHLVNEWPVRHPNLPAPFLTQVFRPVIVQMAYYAQGREGLAQVNALRRKADLAPITLKENQKKITSTPVGRSKHERTPAEAIDIAFCKQGTKELNWDPANFERAWEILREFDPRLVWGKSFSKLVDLPHFEI